MEFDNILGVIAALSGEPIDPADSFGDVARGGHVPAYPVEIVSCPVSPGYAEVEGQSVVCGAVSVPEDHTAPGEPNRIDLLFALFRSHSSVPADDPLLYLHGGPGSGNLNGLSYVAGIFEPWRQTRDVIMFDQRAAGLSAISVACHQAITDQIAAIVKGDLGAVFGACFEEPARAGYPMNAARTCIARHL